MDTAQPVKGTQQIRLVLMQRQAGRQRDRQADRQTDRQADRQAGREAGRDTDRETESVSEWDLFAMKVCTDKEIALAGRCIQ